MALSSYLRALELRRASDDVRGESSDSSGIAAIYVAQGAFGCALSSFKDALHKFQEINDQTYELAGTKVAYGNLLSFVGNFDEGRKLIEEGLRLSTQLNHESTEAAALNALGDNYYYSGDYASASRNYRQALQIATKAAIKAEMAQKRSR